MNLKTARARLALIEQEAAILRDYITRMESLGEQPKGQPFSALPTRARNSLLWVLNPGTKDIRGLPDPSPEQIADLSRSELSREANIGRVTIQDIEAWLISHGLELRR
jgi:hypothetical protein